MKRTCQHLRLELRGISAPHPLGTDLWLSTEHLVCLDCGTRLMNVPKYVTRIINIPHPQPEECRHENKTYHLGGLGEWTCLNCGERGVSTPSARLHISGGGTGAGKDTPLATLRVIGPSPLSGVGFWGERVGINAPTPQADPHIIGTVMRIQQESGDYGVIRMGPKYDTEFVVGLLQRELLRFEGQGIEIAVRRLGCDPAERETATMEERLLMLLRHDKELGLWVVDEDSVHHLEDYSDAVELEIAVITLLAKAEPFLPQDPAEE